MERAYSITSIKAIDDEAREIEGIASSPTVDRVGDIIEPLGAKFALPLPLLWQHRSDSPVGWVKWAKPTKAGIPFKATLAKIPDPGPLRDSVETAWQALKAKLIGAVSIGFKITEHEPLDEKQPWGGWRIKAWEWLELSLVTIPANPDATITAIRSLAHQELAATGRALASSERHPPPASRHQPVKASEGKPMAKKSIAEQISAYESTRAAKAARMLAIMEDSGEKGETLDESQQQEYDGISTEIATIDGHLKRLTDLEKLQVREARHVNGNNADEGSNSRAVNGNGNGEDRRWPVVTSVRPQLPQGQPFIRAIMARAAAVLDPNRELRASEIARQTWPDHPEIEAFLKAAVAVGNTTNTTWASPLVYAQNLPGEFAEFLRPMTIIGRLPGLRRVPFNIRVPRQTGGATVNWVGEAAPKPLSSLAFDSITLLFTKLAGIIAMTDELVRFSSPAAEAIVRQELAAAIIQMMDRDFVDPTKAAVTGVSPASITNGVTPVTATGTTPTALQTDVGTLMEAFLNNNMSLSGAVWIMNETQALQISMMRTALDQPEFPGISASGGTFVGLPVVTSENLPDVGGSPANGSIIILAKTNEILLADDGDVSISVSDQASLQMDSAPDSPPTASTVTVSLWQNNMIAVRAERYINWTKRRATAVGYINQAKYKA